MTRSRMLLLAFVFAMLLGAVAPASAQDSTTLRPLDNVEGVIVLVGLAALVMIGFVYAARGRENSRDE